MSAVHTYTYSLFESANTRTKNFFEVCPLLSLLVIGVAILPWLSVSLQFSTDYLFLQFLLKINTQRVNVTNSFRHFSMADESVQRMPGLNPTAVEPHSTSASAAS